jgi:hypothetical protein
MQENVETQMVDFMRPLFGGMAEKTIENQKKKLGFEDKPLTYDEYEQVIVAIGDLCKHMAGDAIAVTIRAGLMEILKAGE